MGAIFRWLRWTIGWRRSAAGQPAGHRALRRGDGREPGCDASAAVGHQPAERVTPFIVIAAAPRLYGAEHRLQRGGAPGDHHRSGFSTAAITILRSGSQARGFDRAHDRHHHLSVDDSWRRKFGARCAKARSNSTSTSSPDRILPALPGRQIRRPLRRQHLPAHHQGRSTTSTRLRPSWRPVCNPETCEGGLPAVSFTSDWRFSPARSRENHQALVDNA